MAQNNLLPVEALDPCPFHKFTWRNRRPHLQTERERERERERESATASELRRERERERERESAP